MSHIMQKFAAGADTARLWNKLGHIVPIAVTPGGVRIYSPERTRGFLEARAAADAAKAAAKATKASKRTS